MLKTLFSLLGSKSKAQRRADAVWEFAEALKGRKNMLQEAAEKEEKEEETKKREKKWAEDAKHIAEKHGRDLETRLWRAGHFDDHKKGFVPFCEILKQENRSAEWLNKPLYAAVLNSVEVLNRIDKCLTTDFSKDKVLKEFNSLRKELADAANKHFDLEDRTSSEFTVNKDIYHDINHELKCIEGGLSDGIYTGDGDYHCRVYHRAEWIRETQERYAKEYDAIKINNQGVTTNG